MRPPAERDLGAKSGKMFEIELTADADKFYSAADRVLAKKLARCFARLELEPRRHNNIKLLHGRWAGLYRFRVGIYEIDDAVKRITVLDIAHRREVYE